MAMTSRERVAAALAHREPDRTPLFEYVLLSPLADRLLGRTYGGDPQHWPTLLKELGYDDAVRRNAVDRLELALRLGHDLLYVTPNPPPPGPPAPAAPPPPNDPLDRLRLRCELARGATGPRDESLLVYHYLHEEMDRRGVDLPLLAPAYAHGVWTDVDLMQTMALDPELAREHFQLATQRALASIERYLELGLDQIGIGGDFAGTRLLISPEFYRTYIVPELRLLAEKIHAGGAVAINASDGDLWSVLDDFLLATGVDGYLEIDLHAGMDLGRLKRTYGDQVCLYGNLDCGNQLSFSSPAEVRQQTLACLDAGWGNGGHILCASNAITASVPLENYLAVIGAYRERFGLPRFEIA